jgi:hypothetical protein
MEKQKTSHSQEILSKMRNMGGITILAFKLYYRPTVIKSARNWHKNRSEEQKIRRDNPDTSPHRCDHSILTKEYKVHVGEKTDPSKYGSGKTGNPPEYKSITSY